MARAGHSESIMVRVEVEDAKTPCLTGLGEEVVNNVDNKVRDISRDTANSISRDATVDTGHIKTTLWFSRSYKRIATGDWEMENLTLYGIRQNFEHRTMGGYMTNPIEEASLTFTKDVLDAVLEVIHG